MPIDRALTPCDLGSSPSGGTGLPSSPSPDGWLIDPAFTRCDESSILSEGTHARLAERQRRQSSKLHQAGSTPAARSILMIGRLRRGGGPLKPSSGDRHLEPEPTGEL